MRFVRASWIHYQVAVDGTREGPICGRPWSQTGSFDVCKRAHHTYTTTPHTSTPGQRELFHTIDRAAAIADPADPATLLPVVIVRYRAQMEALV